MKYPLVLSLTRSQRLFLTLCSICRWCLLPCALRIIFFSIFRPVASLESPLPPGGAIMSNIPTAQNREWGLSHPVCGLNSVVLTPPPPQDWILIPSSQTFFLHCFLCVFSKFATVFLRNFVSTLNFGYVFSNMVCCWSSFHHFLHIVSGVLVEIWFVLEFFVLEFSFRLIFLSRLSSKCLSYHLSLISLWAMHCGLRVAEEDVSCT